MKNVMVCVTRQKSCDRLIRYGHDLLGQEEGELFILHVTQPQLKILGKSKEGDALEYLYEKALEYGANLTVIRSGHVLDTLIQQAHKNNISHIIMGQSPKGCPDNLAEQLSQKLTSDVSLITIPA